MAGGRADMFLVRHGFATSRAEAQAAIRAGKVTVDGRVLVKPAQTLREGAEVQYAPAHPYVSRGGVKLAAALERFGLSPEARICLDVGASTGGFTQVLLEHGAAHVTAVDVGHGQMHSDIATDARVTVLQGVNARDLSSRHIARPPHAIVADVSFISLKLAMPAALALAADDAWVVLLVKPQFEVGRKALSKGGIVRDARAREAALKGIVQWIAGAGWKVRGTMESPVAGGDGNLEYLLAAVK